MSRQVFGRKRPGLWEVAFGCLSLPFVMALSLGSGGCSKLSGSSGYDASKSRFSGVEAVRPAGDGTFTVSWKGASAKSAVYAVYRREASGAAMDYSQPWKRTTETVLVTENLLLSPSTCFAVRLEVPGYEDGNRREVCTGHEPYVFGGLTSAVLSGADVLLKWSPVPLDKVEYRIFDALTPDAFEFELPTASVQESRLTLPAPAFGTRHCYAVRFHLSGFSADTNTHSICLGEEGLGSFAGVASAMSSDTGTVDVSWAAADGAALYRVYQGASFTTKLAEASASAGLSLRLAGLTPELSYEFGVRAVDTHGREDANTKTLRVQVANNVAPAFAGISALTLSGTTGVKASWAPASPIPRRYNVYLARRDATHAQASLNCALSANAGTCRDLLDWTSPYTTAVGAASDVTLPALADDQTVFLAVRAVSQSGVEDLNAVVKGVAIPDAGAPQFEGLAEVSLSGGRARLAWSVPVGQTSQYRVFTTRGGQTTSVDIAALGADGVTPVLEYTTGQLLSTTTYTFAVKAIDRHGNLDGNSVTRSVTTGDTVAPGAVQGLSATAGSETVMGLSFTSPSDTDVSSYRFWAEKCLSPTGSIFAATPSCATWGSKVLVSATLSGGNPGPSALASATVTSLEGRTLYRFYVSAVDGAGNVGTETARSAPTLDTTPPLFSGVRSVVQHPSEASKVRVSWDSPGGDVARYIVYRAQRSGGSCFPGLTLSGGGATPPSAAVSSVTVPDAEATLYDFSDLTTGGEVWCFAVHAVDDRNNEDSNTASRTYTIPDLTPPNFDANATTVAWDVPSDGIQVTWAAAAGASQYRISVQCINVYNCSGDNGSTCEYPGQTAAGAWPTTDSAWQELALVNAPATSYTLGRLGGSGLCAGGEYRRYRFLVTARKPTSEWQVNATVKPGVNGELMPDLTKPAWPGGSALTVAQSSDVPGSESVLVQWPKATEVYSSPVRSGSGIAGYDIYLVRTSAPTRVLVKSSIAGTWNAGASRLETNLTASDMASACAAATPAVNDTSCLFSLGNTYTFSIRAKDNASNIQGVGEEVVSLPKTLTDVTSPTLSQAGISPASIAEAGSATLTFTASENGTYRILECTSNCGTAGATYLPTAVATGTMTASTQKSVTLAASLFSGGGAKSLAIEIKDALLNTSLYHAGSTPAVPTLTVVDVTAPTLSGAAISPASIEAADTATFSFTSNESGTYRLLECTSACNTGGASYAAVATGTMTAATQKTVNLAGAALTSALGVKNLALELKDSSNNTSTYHGATTPTVPTVTLMDVTPPSLSVVSLSSSSVEAGGSVTFTFTANETGTYRVLECTSGCNTAGAVYAQVAAGSMTAATPRGVTILGSSLTPSLGTKNLALEIKDATLNVAIYHGATFPAVPALSLVDLTAPTIASVSVSPGTVNDGNSFAVGFICSEACSWRILDVTSTAVVLASSNGVTTSSAVSQSIAATSLSPGSGTKTLAIEVKDALLNTATFHNATTPAVPQVLRNAKPAANVTGFRILRYNNAVVPTFRLSWTLPAGIGATDTVEIRKGTATVPMTCSDGTLVVSKASTDQSHEVAVGSDTVGNVSFAVFVRTAAGICADGTTASRALWALSGTVTSAHTPNTASYSLVANQNDVSVRVAESRSRAKVVAWDGGNENSSTSVCASPATCSADLTNVAYFSVSTQTGLASGTPRVVSFDYSNPVQNPAWAKRRHRFYFESLDGKNGSLTVEYSWVKAPQGMVFVAAENWPNGVAVTGSSPAITESYPTTATSGDWDLVPHDFAIDKYEASLGSGSLGIPNSFPNSETGVLVSAATLPAVNSNWYAFKQGCLNRSYYSDSADYPSYVATGDLSGANSHGAYSIPNPRRKFHMTTGMEWMVGAYGTPDTASCNFSGSNALDPVSNNLACLSAVGARNMIGNVWEWSDDWARSGHRGSLERWTGTTAVQSLLGASLLSSADGSSGSWSFRGSGRVSVGANVSVSSDGFWRFYEDGGAVAGGHGGGSGWAAVRGGGWGDGATAGRFALYLGSSPVSVNTVMGGRCALSGPQPRALLARFGSASDGSAARLFWLVHDTENTSNVLLGRAATKAEIDGWNGNGISDGQTVGGVTVEAKVPGVAFSNPCGWTPAAGNTYTGSYCNNAIAGDNYYKLCVTNPALPQVLDEYTAAERTVCSEPILVRAAATPPALNALNSGMLLQNDSDGAFARFYWKESGGTNVVRKLIMGVDKGEVERWNGDAAAFNGWDDGNGWAQATYVGTLGGLKILTGGPAGNAELTSECSLAHLGTDGTTWGAYTPDVGAAGGHATGATHYACVNLSRFPKWSKFWFKVAIASSDAATNSGNVMGAWQMSEVHGAGHVPTGMTLVAAEEWGSLNKTNADGDPAEDYRSWPLCVGASGGYPAFNAPAHVMPGLSGWPFADGIGCVYDFAIDKYEAYDGGGTWANGAFSAENSFAGNGTTGVLWSLRNKTAHNNYDWYAFKRGCDNRTSELVSAGFVAAGATPLGRSRLPTGVEWTVAGAATKDENVQGVCNVSSGGQHAGGTGSLVNCVSRFGSFDQIGNVWEWSDEVRTSTINPEADINNMVWKRFLGTVSVSPFPGGSGNGSVPSRVNTASDGWADAWSLLTGFPSATGGSGTKSYYWQASDGDKRAAARGGSWGNGANAGRFALYLGPSPLYVVTSIGGRCALSGP